MPYTQLLNDLIDKSGLSIKEIAERCSAHSQEITASYISLLRNTESKRIPSDDLSRALAIACNAKYDDLLIVEGYIDRAPKALAEFINMVRDSSISAASCMFVNQMSKQEMKSFQDVLSQQPMAEFIIETAQQPQAELEKGQGEIINLQGSLKDGDMQATIQFKTSIGLPVQDDSMHPTLSKGSKTILEVMKISEYKDGDILCFSKKGHKEFIYRKCVFIDGLHKKIAMLPMNTQFPSAVYSFKEIVILGKVKQSIIDFNYHL